MSDSDSGLDDELYHRMYRQKPAAQEPSASEGEDDNDEDEDLGSRAPRAPKPPAKRQKTGSGREGRTSQAAQELDDDDDAVYENEEDRARLMSMNEFQREMIIAERKEKLLQQRERQNLLARKAKQAEAPKAVTVATRRPDAKTKAMDTIRKAQEKKKASSSAKRRDDDFLADEEEVSESDSADEAELTGPSRDMDYEDAAPARPSTRATAAYDDDDDDYPEENIVSADYDQIVSIQVRRHRLEKWVNEPFFEDCLRNSVVKIALGTRRDSNGGPDVKQYVMATVEGVVSYEDGQHKDINGRMVTCPYAFGSPNARTDKWLEVARGSSRKVVTLALISNERITPQEYEHWRKQCKRDRQQGVIAHAEVAEIKQRLLKAENYTYTAEDVAAMVAAKRKRGIVKGSVAAEKARLQRLLQAAREKGAEEEEYRLQEELQALQGRQSVAVSAVGKPAIHEINKKNTDINFKNMLANVSSRPEGALNAADGETVDVFSRRKTQPMVMIKPQKVGVRDVVPENRPTAPSPVPTPSKLRKPQAKVSAGGIPDIDIDLSLLSNAPRSSQRLAHELMGDKWLETLSAETVNAQNATTRQHFLTPSDYIRRAGVLQGM